MNRRPEDTPCVRERHRYPPLIVLVLVLAAAGFFCAAPPLAADGTETSLPQTVWFGTVSEGLVHERALPLRNPGPLPLYVKFTPGCGCLSVDPAELAIGSGETAHFTVRFDAAGYAGETAESVFVKSSDPAFHNRVITVEAFVESVAASTAGGSGGTGADPAEGTVRAPGCGEIAHLATMERLRARAGESVLYTELFYSVGCRECEAFLAEELPGILAASRTPIVVKVYNILDDAGFETYLTRSAAAGVEAERFPALLSGTAVYEGIDRIRSYLSEAAGRAAGTAAAPPETGTLPGKPVTGGSGAVLLSAVPVLSAGLLDGINPCAFTTIIFLVSALAVTGRSRGRILLTGVVFAASVFMTYYLVGLGAFTLIRTASSFTAIAVGLKWVLFASLLVFASLSVHDAIRLRAGDTAAVLLQLPSDMKRRIHRTVHGSLKIASLAAGAAAMGALVSIFELACTGQVYLPTITYMVARGERTAYGLLALYNTGFILPLAAVFALVYAGTGSKRLAELFRRRMAAVKLALAGLFLVLGVLTLLL